MTTDLIKRQARELAMRFLTERQRDALHCVSKPTARKIAALHP